MIEPVSRNPYADYQAGKAPKVNTATGDTSDFSNALKESDSGVIYEHGPKQSKSKELPSSGESGETLPGDHSVYISEDKETNQSEPNAILQEATGLFQSISNFFQSLFTNVVKLLGNIWESKPLADGLTPVSLQEESSDETDSITEAESVPSEEEFTYVPPILPKADEKGDPEILEALHRGDDMKFQSLLTAQGEKMPARSTDILTQYDRTGRLTAPTPSDADRILHGNRSNGKY